MVTPTASPEETNVTEGQGTNGNEMSCTMNGYTALVADFVTVATALISIGIKAVGAVLPEDLAMAVWSCYMFLTNSASWIGYIISAVYFLGEEFGFGAYLCQGFQILYKVVYVMKILATMDFSAMFG